MADAPPDWQPTLVGETLLVRPLRADDFAALAAAASDPLLWSQHPEPNRHEPAVFARFFAGALASGGGLLVLDAAGGEVLGASRFYEWCDAPPSVVIGYTFLVRTRWGGATNGELKRLMLAHAFRWAETVWFHVGPSNRRSQRALERIGARLDHERGEGSARRLVYRIDRDPADAGGPRPEAAVVHERQRR
jgi:RimJ/RimL family protein N-acetyltransferase